MLLKKEKKAKTIPKKKKKGRKISSSEVFPLKKLIREHKANSFFWYVSKKTSLYDTLANVND